MSAFGPRRARTLLVTSQAPMALTMSAAELVKTPVCWRAHDLFMR